MRQDLPDDAHSKTSLRPSPERLSLKGQLWVQDSFPDRWVQQLTQTFSLSPFVAHLLASRTNTLAEAESFLTPSLKNHLPDPACLPDIDPAIACLARAITQKKVITVWGDYDVDGATSSALWVRFLRSLGCAATIYIPDRFREGYGPNAKALQELAEGGTQVVIMVDCGTTAFEPLEAAKELGLEVVVIDHHMPEAKLPPCSALVNPKRLDASPQAVPFQTLAAVGLSFFVAMALNRTLRSQNFYTEDGPEPSILPLLDIVALGTVCDVMPLLGINRTLVSKGLQVMAKRLNLGLKTLMDVAQLREPPSAYHLGFVLGPRINAGGRIGASSLGARLLTTEDASEAFQIATQLDTLNKERQEIEKTLEIEAVLHAQLQETDPVIVVSGNGWHQGVIGIIAGRLKERFHKPTFVIGWEGEDGASIGKGSARSIPGLDVGSLIHEARLLGLILGGGGHAMAGGLSLSRSQLAAFQEFLCKKISAALPERQAPRLVVGSPLTFQALETDLLEKIQSLAPFGQGNPQPIAVFHDLRLQSAFPVGEHHLRLQLSQMDGRILKAMAFRVVGKPLGDFLTSRPQAFFSLAATLQRNTYDGKPQLIVEDIYVP